MTAAVLDLTRTLSARTTTNATTASCLPCELAAQAEAHASRADPVPEGTPDQQAADASASGGGEDLSALPPIGPRVRWSGVIGVEGELTGDGRLIQPNALRWETLPLKLRYVSSDVGAHDGAVVVGNVESIQRRPKGQIYAEGWFDLGSASGREAARHVDQGLTNGVSMDLDDVSFEVRVAAELVQDEGSMLVIPFLSSDGEQHAEDDEEGEPSEPLDLPEPDEDGRVTIAQMSSDDEVRVTTDGRVRAATLVAIPAFAGATISLSEPIPTDLPALVAGGSRLAAGAGGSHNDPPPREWFDDPRLVEPTPLVVGPDGRVYGHIALWGTCHLSHTAAGKCVTPPHSAADYRWFHTGATHTSDHQVVATGHITMDTRHATLTASPATTMAHYEDTGLVAADVRAGEDNFGIWVAGAARPHVMNSPEKLRALRAAPMSGDWRGIGGASELVAVLAVTTPGFPVPRPAGVVHEERVMSLVASGMLPPRKVIPPSAADAFLSVDDLRYLQRLIKRERERDSGQNLVAGASPDEIRVRAFALRRRVHGSPKG